jgi:hypothetical protein
MPNLNFSIIQELQHQGICDASVAVPLGQDRFIVGNDEADKQLGNVLRVVCRFTSKNDRRIEQTASRFTNLCYGSQLR